MSMSVSGTNPGDTTASDTDAPATKYPPCRTITDSKGQKWRLCAGVAVLNSNNDILVGERIHVPDAWQTPQGGVDVGETITQAAARELYEEVGLLVGEHVLLESTLYHNHHKEKEEIQQEEEEEELLETLPGGKYETTGTDSWLSKSGYTGQDLRFVMYRCIDARLEMNPNQICNLTGLNGEKAEFTQVRWDTMEQILKNVWEKKREPYWKLLQVIKTIQVQWEEKCNELDFTGTWTRDNELSTNVMEGLVARGISQEDAERLALEPYVQTWNRSSSSPGEWMVTTCNTDGTTPRRNLLYQLGEWEEEFKGQSTLFGSTEGRDGVSVVKRRTMYLAEPDAKPRKIAHVTLSETLLGMEEARRYVKDDTFILRRAFWSKDDPENAVVSTEVFVRRRD